MRKIILAAAIAAAVLSTGGCHWYRPVPIRPVPQLPIHSPGFRHPAQCPEGQRPIGYLSDGVTLDCVAA